MQVSCSSCGAKYEFDASAIPAAGYDAQCTTCNAIFFVSPDADGQSPAPTPTQSAAASPPVGLKLSEQVAVSCNHCGAVYQFSAADIPQEGYDAQCTQCQGVFFVSVAGAAKVSPTAPAAGAGATTEASSQNARSAAPSREAADTPEQDPQMSASDIAASFSAAPQDIPTAAEEDFSSMSQVIAMERLEAKQRANQAQATSAASAPSPVPAAHAEPKAEAPKADAPSEPAPSQAPDAAFEASSSTQSAAPLEPEAPPASEPTPDAAQAPALLQDAASPELNPVPSWGIAAPEMAALASEPEAIAAPDAALAATTAVPPSAAETGVGFAPSGFVQNPAAATPAPTGLESFSLSSAVLASEPEMPAPADEPHADAPDPTPVAQARPTSASHLRFDDDDQSADGDNTSADLQAPGGTKGRTIVIAASVAVLALGGAAFGAWRTGMLGGKVIEHAAQTVAAVTDTAAGAQASGDKAQAPAAAIEPEPQAPPASPKARVAFERGMRSLLDDTTAGYATAQEAFREALKIEPAMVDAHAGLALQALLGGEDALALGHAEWAEAKKLEGVAAAYQAKLGAPMPRGRHQKDFERERLRMTEAMQQVAQMREKAILHLQIGEDTLHNGAMILLRGSMLPAQTPLMRASMALWLASDPYVANPGESGATFNAARTQFTEAARWLQAPGDEGAQGAAAPKGADAKDPWARTWLSLAKARILAAKPTTAVQVQPFLEGAIAREPHFMRGRWEVARALEQASQKGPALKAAENLLTVMPTHEKAKALVDSLKAVDNAPAPAAAADKPAGKARGRGVHRLKRGR